MKSIMLQGTSSDVGKSVLCTALGRIFYEDGYKVAPFKSQNMALNSYITDDGGEIGRAQGVQAEACGVKATVDMNPILLKPKHDMMAEVIIRGKRLADVEADVYRDEYVERLLPVIKDSLQNLSNDYDILVMEGAGSPAEINLKNRDIANMKAAELADAPVLLVADIDRGGVFASLVGTLTLLDDHERSRVKGFIINKFRGKRSLLDPGLDWLEKYTGIPVLGVIPYAETGIEAEDSLALSALKLKKQDECPESLNIAVIRLPYISNFTDIDPLYEEPGVNVRLVSSVSEWNRPDIIILPGTKNTTKDLLWLNKSGLSTLILQAVQEGAYLTGICGGYQMLGHKLLDPFCIESDEQVMTGLKVLPLTTTFSDDKNTTQVQGVVRGAIFAEEQEVTGYEIHLGESECEWNDNVNPLFQLDDGRLDGLITKDQRIWGTYLHGIFHNRKFTRKWLNQVRNQKGIPTVSEDVLSESERREANYAALSALVRENLDMNQLYEIMGLKYK